jgi:CheY-like chemotaxis protein
MQKPAFSFPPRTILVVDDEPFVCDAVRLMLRFDGHIVHTVGSAKEALEVFEEGKFDLIITDFEMPVMKGDKLAAAIKAKPPARPCQEWTSSSANLFFSRTCARPSPKFSPPKRNPGESGNCRPFAIRPNPCGIPGAAARWPGLN